MGLVSMVLVGSVLYLSVSCFDDNVFDTTGVGSLRAAREAANGVMLSFVVLFPFFQVDLDATNPS